MGTRVLAAIPLVLLLPGCRPASPPFDEAVIRLEVEAYLETIAGDLGRDGPRAWLRHFERAPGFFMAAGGAVRFPDNASADELVERFARQTGSIELAWRDVRVDPLTPSLAQLGAGFFEIVRDTAGAATTYEGYFTALAERRGAAWRLRNLHWSMIDEDD